ncbi:M14 family metallopeptidase [Myroides pelagicus]|uniref:DUF2817 domain-containing protein n=1 Tax=Myroides pelagicus TaxID=270914 RepID=A0A7K1GKX2_9FLAO|nr:M14 metallopeptidase family protein [Myroides pelagicus]MEC4113809.1 M14 metallopeptidase family protein [Myroides pelagicus]MTH29083.1 DUF2817 domain-containing protein [Myroides pelagicus]
MNIDTIVNTWKCNEVTGRYVTTEMISPVFNELGDQFSVRLEGSSVLGKEIKSVCWGQGQVKILMWSQMHGNESTTTKAVMDLLKFLSSEEEEVKQWFSYFTIKIVPILNPDGASAYTRINANQVDLNRDSIDLTQPESKVLRSLLEEFRPNYAFNLHDQRTIFGVGDTPEPATISFLSPAFNEQRDLSASREEAMRLIVAMYNELCVDIHGKIGRFDDSFNKNCIGDYCQTLDIPTILFEAGHYPEDYEREVTRKVVFKGLLTVISQLKSGAYRGLSVKDYFAILENKKNFVDIIFTNVENAQTGEIYVLEVQYLEVLRDNKVEFEPMVVGVADRINKFAHLSIKNSYFLKDCISSKEALLNRKLSEVMSFEEYEIKKLLKK